MKRQMQDCEQGGGGQNENGSKEGSLLAVGLQLGAQCVYVGQVRGRGYAVVTTSE